MSFISYAQNYEDVMLWRALKHIENGFYIDIGAAWPVEHSVTKAFYDRGWYGVNVEPNPQHYHALESHRPKDINVQAALGDEAGSLNISVFRDTGLSTLDVNIAKSHISHGYACEIITVPVITLNDIYSQHIENKNEVHFLKIDVEGFEQQVISGNDWKVFRPWIVVVEATEPMSQIESYISWEPILINNDYIFAYGDGLNRFYVALEHSNLIDQLKYPPNVFDEFITSTQLTLQQELNQTKEQVRSVQEQAISAQEQAISAQEQALEAKKLAEQFHQQLLSIHLSKSWRFTAPFRKIVEFILDIIR